MLENQIDQAERRATLRNDLKVRQQEEGGTFHQHAVADASTPRGRFSAIANAQVIGATAIPSYPAAAAHQADPCGTEPPLGFEIDAMPELEPSSLLAAEAQATPNPASVAPSNSLDVEQRGAGLGLFQTTGDPATEEAHFPPQPGMVPKSGSPPLRRRRM